VGDTFELSNLFDKAWEADLASRQCRQRNHEFELRIQIRDQFLIVRDQVTSLLLGKGNIKSVIQSAARPR
jgi:hypothetical protein